MGAAECALKESFVCQGKDLVETPTRLRATRAASITSCCRTEDGNFTDVEDCCSPQVPSDPDAPGWPKRREDRWWAHDLGRPAVALGSVGLPDEPVAKLNQISAIPLLFDPSAGGSWAASFPDFDPSGGVSSDGLSLKCVRAQEVSGDNSPSATLWLRHLRRGVAVALDGEPVTVSLDMELGCLEVREHESLYPLAELRTCNEVPHGEGDTASPYDLTVTFGQFETLLFQFDEEEQRAGFKAALDSLAASARRGHLHESHSADGSRVPLLRPDPVVSELDLFGHSTAVLDPAAGSEVLVV